MKAIGNDPKYHRGWLTEHFGTIEGTVESVMQTIEELEKEGWRVSDSHVLRYQAPGDTYILVTLKRKEVGGYTMR